MKNCASSQMQNSSPLSSPLKAPAKSFPDATQPKNSIVLVKGVLNSYPKSNLNTFFSQFGAIKRIILKPTTLHYYIEFEEINSVEAIEAQMAKCPIMLKGRELEIVRINKIPLDLNEPSKVILITFMGVIEKIELSLVQELLEPFGVIEKVVIIKKKNTQVLVEMDTIENSEKITESFANSVMVKGMKTKVQYTAKKNLVVSNDLENEFDFTVGETEGQETPKNEIIQETNFVSEEETAEKTAPKTEKTEKTAPKTAEKKFKFEPYHTFPARGDSKIQPPPGFGPSIATMPIISSSATKNRKNQRTTNPFWKEQARAVHVKNLDSFITHELLFNLFSLYGNIEKMDLNSTLGEAMVLYQSSKQMKMAIDHLLGLTLFGRVLILALIHQNSNPIEGNCLSKDYKGFKDQRFKIPNSKNWKNINPASTTVHLSNLAENCSLSQVKTLFTTIATPRQITYFKDNTSMALACFDSIDSAIRIITTFHNHPISGKFLKVAFAKYNLMVTHPPKNR